LNAKEIEDAYAKLQTDRHQLRERAGGLEKELARTTEKLNAEQHISDSLRRTIEQRVSQEQLRAPLSSVSPNVGVSVVPLGDHFFVVTVDTAGKILDSRMFQD
jgi:hypothetical protein